MQRPHLGAKQMAFRWCTRSWRVGKLTKPSGNEHKLRAQDSPAWHSTTLVTRYALVSRGEREAKDEMKEGLLGSDRPKLFPSQTLSEDFAVTFCRLGVMSTRETRERTSVKTFP